MIEDPRSQQMKSEIRRLIWNVIVTVVVVLVISMLWSGFSLPNVPKREQIVSAQVTLDGRTVQVEEQDLQLASDLGRGLRRWFGQADQTMPRALITYTMTDGSQMTVGANAATLYQDGSFYPSRGKNGSLFEQVVEGVFFGSEQKAD